MGIIRINKAQRLIATTRRGQAMSDTTPQNQTDQDIVYTSRTEIACDGDGGALGHPKVFLHMENGQVECPYCDRLFILKADAD